MISEDEILSDSDISECVSVNSIPWAEGAIRKNQLDWELLQSQLNGTCEPPTNDKDLYKEILDWRVYSKFLKLNDKKLKRNSETMKHVVPMETNLISKRAKLTMKSGISPTDSAVIFKTPRIPMAYTMRRSERSFAPVSRSAAIRKNHWNELVDMLQNDLKINSISLEKSGNTRAMAAKKRDIKPIQQTVSLLSEPVERRPMKLSNSASTFRVPVLTSRLILEPIQQGKVYTVLNQSSRPLNRRL